MTAKTVLGACLLAAFGAAASAGCAKNESAPNEKSSVSTTSVTSPTSSAAASATAAPESPPASANAPALERNSGGTTGDGSTIASAKSIGNTSVVFKLGFASGEKAAYKPHSIRGRDRYKGEIAAYRLAKALGIPNVPEVAFRRFARSALEGAMASQPSSLDLARRELVADTDGSVSGALIPWIKDLDFLKVESEPLRGRWHAWLLSAADAAIEDPQLAAQISRMIVFDSVTGNWDRWSGANVGWNAASHTLLFVDNDGAFMVPVPSQPFARQRELIRSLKRYPKGMLDKLRALEPSAMKVALGEEAPGTPLLSDAALRELEARRKTVLDEADRRIKERGVEKVLVFE